MLFCFLIWQRLLAEYTPLTIIKFFKGEFVMKNHGKFIKSICLLMSTLIVLSMVACGSGNSTANTTPATDTASNTTAPGEKIDWDTYEPTGKIVYWAWNQEQLDSFTEAVNKKYPQLEVETLLVQGSDYITKLQTALASGGEVPDILQAEKSARGTLFDLGIFDNLLNAPYNVDTSLYLDSMVANNSNREGELLGLDQQIAPMCLVYRKDLTEKYFGVSSYEDVSNYIKTWDDFQNAGLKLKEQTDDVYMMSGLDDYLTTMFYTTEDGNAFDYEANTYHISDRLDFVNKAMENVAAGFPLDRITHGSTAWNASVAEGNVIFYYGTIWALKSYFTGNAPEFENQDKFGVCMVPGGKTGTFGGTTMGINKFSKNKEAAYAAMRYMWGTDEGCLVWKETRGWLPSLKSFYDTYGDLPGYPDPWFGNNNVGLWIYENVAPYAITNDTGLMYQYSSNAFTSAVTQAMANPNATAEEIISTAKSELALSLPEATID